MSSYTISQSEIWRRRAAPLWAVLWGAIAGLISFWESGVVSLALVVGFGLAGLLAFAIWKNHREFLNWAPSHQLQVAENGLVLKDDCSSSSISWASIESVHINFKSGKPHSVILKRNDGLRENLPRYEKLEALLELLREKLGDERVRSHRWLHV